MVAIYVCHFSWKSSWSLALRVIWAEVDSTVKFFRLIPRIIGGKNDMKYIGGVTERERRSCMPSQRFKKTEAVFALILR